MYFFSDLDQTQEKLLNANQRLEDKEKALLNAEGEVAMLNRRISNLEEELEKTEDRFVTNIYLRYCKVANSSAFWFWLIHVSVSSTSKMAQNLICISPFTGSPIWN